MTSYVWYANAAVVLLALLVLVLGLTMLPGDAGGAKAATPWGTGAETEDDAGSNVAADPNQMVDSPLIAVVKRYSKRIAPPPPTPKREPVKPKPPKPEPVKIKPPKPEPVKIKPPDPEPVKPKVPKPDFALTGTIVIGENYGGAYVKRNGKPVAETFWVGDMIGRYKVVRVMHGKVDVTAEGETFTVSVPKPAPPAAGLPSKAPSPPKPERNRPARPARPKRK